MNSQIYSGLFIAEGTSDFPLADSIEALFLDRGISISLRKPDFELLGRVGKDVRSRVAAGLSLTHGDVDVIVIHRDADNVGAGPRRAEIEAGVRAARAECPIVPIIPVRMTEAWLLLDEAAIRHVAGNPRGRQPLSLPAIAEVERKADPKTFLAERILEASNVTGRRRERLKNRFNQNRRQLLERLDRGGPVNQLAGWQALVADIDEIAAKWNSNGE